MKVWNVIWVRCWVLAALAVNALGSRWHLWRHGGNFQLDRWWKWLQGSWKRCKKLSGGSLVWFLAAMGHLARWRKWGTKIFLQLWAGHWCRLAEVVLDSRLWRQFLFSFFIASLLKSGSFYTLGPLTRTINQLLYLKTWVLNFWYLESFCHNLLPLCYDLLPLAMLQSKSETRRLDYSSFRFQLNMTSSNYWRKQMFKFIGRIELKIYLKALGR